MRAVRAVYRDSSRKRGAVHTDTAGSGGIHRFRGLLPPPATRPDGGLVTGARHSAVDVSPSAGPTRNRFRQPVRQPVRDPLRRGEASVPDSRLRALILTLAALAVLLAVSP